MGFDRGWNPRTSILAGVPRHYLQGELDACQKAWMEFNRGVKVVTASYAQADGNKSVTFNAATINNLEQQIRLLQLQLGIIHRAPRRVLRPVYY
jgi:hypothetical protein